MDQFYMWLFGQSVAIVVLVIFNGIQYKEKISKDKERVADKKAHEAALEAKNQQINERDAKTFETVGNLCAIIDKLDEKQDKSELKLDRAIELLNKFDNKI
jgi:heme exporter protein D